MGLGVLDVSYRCPSVGVQHQLVGLHVFSPIAFGNQDFGLLVAMLLRRVLYCRSVRPCGAHSSHIA